MTTHNKVEVTIVDAPDLPRAGEITAMRETQRTYSLLRDGTRAAVRVRIDPDTNYRYVIENLVGGKWHRLLEGDTVGRNIPFGEAVTRAAAVLYAPSRAGEVAQAQDALDASLPDDDGLPQS